MYLGSGPPRRRTGSNPIRVLILLVLIAAGLYLLTVRPRGDSTTLSTHADANSNRRQLCD